MAAVKNNQSAFLGMWRRRESAFVGRTQLRGDFFSQAGERKSIVSQCWIARLGPILNCSVESVIYVRVHGVTATTLADAPGRPVESNVDLAACVVACPPHGLGLTGSFCWLCQYDSDVEV